MAIYSSGLGFLTDHQCGSFVCRFDIHVSRTYRSGRFTAYLLFIGYLQPIRRLISFTQQFQQGMTGFNRFVELMDVQPGVTDSPDANDVPPVHGDIELRNVSFQYNKHAEVLQNVSLRIPAGSTTAFVGPSGGGKTTLCHLIPRFYDVTGGQILIDGHDIRDVTLSSLRLQIGFVQQDVFLFTGTIRGTFFMVTPRFLEEMIEAAKRYRSMTLS